LCGNGSKGKPRYGERKAVVEAEDWEEPSFEACKNSASVCKAIETSAVSQFEI
jgi:hypothetical protein